jgi:hypothetical protein
MSWSGIHSPREAEVTGLSKIVDCVIEDGAGTAIALKDIRVIFTSPRAHLGFGHCPESRHQHPLASFDVLTHRVRPHVARLPSSACAARIRTSCCRA